MTSPPDLPSELACTITNEFKGKAKALGAAVSLEDMCDFHAFVQGAVDTALRGALGLP